MIKMFLHQTKKQIESPWIGLEWRQNLASNHKQHLIDILHYQAPHQGAFFNEKNNSPSNEDFENNMPWNTKKVWKESYVISNSLQSWEHIPAAFGIDWVHVRQRIDMDIYLWLIYDAKKDLVEKKNAYEKKYWLAIDNHTYCKLAMHTISHSIATKLRPDQHDNTYKAYIDSVTSTWSKELDPMKIKQLQLENCLIKSAIAHQFFHMVWLTSSRFLLSGEKHHAYVEVDTWQGCIRLDVNSPIPLDTIDINWNNDVFYLANMTENDSI